MTLKDQLDAVVKSAISDMGEIRAELTALEHAMPGACRRTANIRQIMMTLTTRLTGIKVIAAKEVMVGNEEPATRQERPEEMELFARAGARHSRPENEHELMLASLHRVGDHSLDEDGDHNVVITEGKGVRHGV